MQTLPVYQIDAFAEQLFGGNPAAVCPLEEWLSDELMQAIAAENNLSETVFFVGEKGHYHIRWFTPGTEVMLCGHATLAASYVIRHELGDQSEVIEFDSLSGPLVVSFNDELIQLDFPSATIAPTDLQEEIIRTLPFTPVEAFISRDDILIIAPDEEAIAALKLDFTQLESCRARGVIISARSEREGVDFVSRWFGGPEVGIQEDPVTGSAHTVMMPYWAEKLGRNRLVAEQISVRKGRLECEWLEDRVLIAGKAVKFLEGVLYLPESTGGRHD